MGSFGQRLQREREMRGITLEEIATSTKIGTRSLRALEEEDFDQLPGGIFNKGFVRAYAKYLGIDEEQAVADYLAAAGEVEQPLPQPPEKPAQAGSGAGTWIALVVLVLGAASYGGWRWYQKNRAGDEGTPPPVVTASPKTAAPAAGAQTAAATPTPVAAAAAITPGGSAANGAADPAKTPDTSAAADGFLLEIRARRGTWVQYTVDDEPRREVSLKPDEQHQIHAQKRLKLVLGNAGGVDILFNGQPLPSSGPLDKARTLSFTPAGLER
jgi:cytoskeleton protein RodZ